MKTFKTRSVTLWCALLVITFSSAQLYADTPIETVSDEVLLQGFEQYLPELVSKQDHEPLLATLFSINRTPLEVQRTVLESIYNSVISANPYKDRTATVRTFDRFTLCQDESATIGKRATFCKSAIEKLLNRKITDNQFPRIGFCFSGGGIRAAVSADGFMKGLAKTGILDTGLYTAALSGSTWLLAPWITSGKKYEEFADELLVRIANGIIGKKLSEQLSDLTSFSSVIVSTFLRRIAFEELPTVIDLYGLMLGLTLLGPDEKKQLLHLDLTSQIPHINQGQAPLPLYSAVYVKNGNSAPSYEWVEFSPFEVTCYDQKAAVPAWAFGRKFEKGTSKNAAPSLPLCYLMGIWGSAISISCGELFGMVVNKLEPQALFDPLKQLLNATTLGDIRIFPAIVRNPTYHLEQSPDQLEPTYTIIDAGIPCNIPLPPLLHRNLDIIIIGDFSSDLEDANELRRAEKYAHAHKLPFPKINYEGIATRTYSVFGNANGDAPIVVYITLVKNTRYLADFDPLKLMGLGYFMNVLNFNYSIDQAKALAGLTEFTVTEMKQLLTKLIAHVVDKKALSVPA